MKKLIILGLILVLSPGFFADVKKIKAILPYYLPRNP